MDRPLRGEPQRDRSRADHVGFDRRTRLPAEVADHDGQSLPKDPAHHH